MINMECPFCKQPMKSLDSGTPSPGLQMVWICKNCVNEVRVLAEKQLPAQEVWVARHISIFVHHKEKEYCMHWNYDNKYFMILDCDKDTGSKEIMSTNQMPTSVTPDNAYDKFLVYVTFS
jgi:hypothetical protein